MKPVAKQQIEYFKNRWFNDDKYRAKLSRLKAALNQNNEAHNQMDARSIESANSVTIYDWHLITSKDMYKGLSALSPQNNEYEFDVYFDSDFQVHLLDLRGWPNDYSGCKLSLTRLENVDLSFSYSRAAGGFARSSIRNSVCFKCDWQYEPWGNYYYNNHFEDCNFSESSVDCSYIERCTFVKCKFRSPKVFRAHIWNTSFQNCSFQNAFFGYGIFINVIFNHCNFAKADMEDNRFINCKFEDCTFANIKSPPILEEIDSDKIDPAILKP